MANAIASAPSPIAPRPIPNRASLRLDPPSSDLLPSISTLRTCHLTADTLSPVNQNGSFEFHRIIKSGSVQKRTRKTKSWRTVYLVLRPNLLSIYRDPEETQLRHKVILSELTAVARQQDPRGKAKHVFGVFSPSRNFHFAARSDKEAHDWVEQVRREARIDEEEEEMRLASPGGAKSTYHGFERHAAHEACDAEDECGGYSSSEAEPLPRFSPQTRVPGARRASTTMDYSGPEQASYSDFSDSGPAARMSALSLSLPEAQVKVIGASSGQAADVVYGSVRQAPTQQGQANPAQASTSDVQNSLARLLREERVVCQGWLYLLKSTSGMRQWKKLWMVLRPRALAMYKNEEEYSAFKILPVQTIISAVEIDAISSSKKYCMQIITEDRNYRLCAPDEDNWAKWLGSIKSLVAKRKEREKERQRDQQSREGPATKEV